MRIPVHAVGPDFPMETLEREEARAHALIDDATGDLPPAALRVLDAISRRWLAKQDSGYLPEIDAIARRLARPGAYFLSVNYEWGCSCKVGPSPDQKSARLVRVLDWLMPGLGREVVAARVAGAAGPFTTLTWPGYTGLLQAMAPQRFSAALNQAPHARASRLLPSRLGGEPSARVEDDATRRRRISCARCSRPRASFADAKRMLAEQPVSTPAIFTLAGLKPSETAVIERTETEARVHEGGNVATNHWQAPGWRGHQRGSESAERACRMHAVSTEFDRDFSWLVPPILNRNTRVVMIADAAEGRLIARGIEAYRPATETLDLAA